jgi:hypothetical protein
MLIREITENIKTEAIAPHGEPKDEFQLMVSGAKPAAIVSPDHFKKMYKPVAEDYGWYYHQMSIPGVKFNNYVVAVNKNTLDRIVQMLTKMNIDMQKGIEPGDAYHRELGQLLGYSRDDIEYFIVHNRELKSRQNGH